MAKDVQASQSSSDDQAKNGGGSTVTVAVQHVGDALFPDTSFQFHTSSRVKAELKIASLDGSGWTLKDLEKAIAMLELHRSMLADEPLGVRVEVFSPRAKPQNQAVAGHSGLEALPFGPNSAQ